MDILDFPVEILDQIIQETRFQDFEALALSCKALYLCSVPYIQRHNAFKIVTLPRGHHHNMLHLLDEVLHHRPGPECIESAQLLNEGDKRATFPVITEEIGRFSAERIRGLLFSSELLQDAGGDIQLWWQCMYPEDRGAEGALCSALFFLSLLPNLRYLQLPRWWVCLRDRSIYMKAVYDLLIEKANDSRQLDRPLGKLETISIFVPPGFQHPKSLRTFEPLLRLASLRNFFLVGACAINRFQKDFIRYVPNTSLALSKVELAYSCLDAEAVSELLKYTPKLQVFKYGHEAKWLGRGFDWNAEAFVQAVAQRCGRTITELAITVHKLEGEMTYAVSDFLSFPKLQHLELDVCVLSGLPREETLMFDESSSSSHQWNWRDETLPCLASLLPASITSLRLNGGSSQSEQVALWALLTNFKEQREMRLPILDHFVVSRCKTSSLRDLVEKVGAQLDDHAPGGREEWPAWLEELEGKVGGFVE